MEATDVGLKAFEKYEKYYTNFKRPPFAKTYNPTDEEFIDPIAYVSQIRREAEKYGIVKIVPPKGFNPSFAIDKNIFNFTPRVQKLDEIDAMVRERNVFSERITLYWELQGGAFRQPTLEGRPVDLFLAHVLIRAEGGFNDVCANKRWTAIAKALGLKSNQAGSKLKDHYSKYVIPFVETIEKNDPRRKDEENNEDGDDEKKEDGTRGLGEGRSTMQGGRNIKSKSPKKKTDTKNDKDMVEVCGRCFRGDSDDKLLKCENCSYVLHSFCMKPPMKERPKNGWHCAPCIEMRIRRMGEDEGFTDSSITYTLNSFAKFANDYKKEMFGKDPLDVTIDEIEKMYWKNMLDGEMDLQVKYGADLMVSKVGSGFCRKMDPNLSANDRLMANHPWNLNNMPVVRDSVLSHIDSSISGMMVPWVYVGMVFSTFCWHTEDHWTYSVNYNHWGEPKIWYGVGAHQATKFEEVVASICPSLFNLHSDLLHHMTVAVNPNLLMSRGVDVYTVHQNPGEFVITFPRAYHAGFNQGLNFAEAVNFAPIDWLSMGRDCMLSYGRVGRKSVFAHDELVMKIARSCERLSTSMALAALEELRIIHTRERENREEARRQGVGRMEKLIFEQIKDDDEKMCRHCNTTLFMSGLRCGHGKSVCLDHMDHLCQKCPLAEAVLLYSHEVDELVPMMDQLKERTSKHEEWEKKASTVHDEIKMGRRPDVHSLECLLDEARTRHYPLNGVYHLLNQIMMDCKKTLVSARTVLTDGVRVRSTTRNQRVDPRCDLAGGREVLRQLKLLPIQAKELQMEIEGLLKRVEEWEERVDGVMQGDVDERAVDKLVEEGEQLSSIRLARLGQLKERERRQKWMRGVKEFLKWRVEDCNEMSVEWKDRKRWTFNDVFNMVEEGRQVGMGNSEEVKEMDKRRCEAVMMDQMARQIMERSTGGGKEEVMAVEETWKRTKEIDWLNAPGMNGLREEMYHLVNIRSYEKAVQYSLFDYVQWIDHLECSRTMNATALAELPRSQVKAMKEWTDGLRKLFELEHSYHSLYEMLVCRENVMALAEGQRPTLRREAKSIESIALWKPVHVYESIHKMVSIVEGVFDRFPTDIDQLRWTHEGLPASKTCPCLSEKESGHPLLECIVCKAKTHLSCGWWNEYLGRLPPACYLCVRCMRSRRPLIGEVKALMEGAKEEWMESQLVTLAIDRFERTAGQVREFYALWKDNRNDVQIQKRLSTLLITLLSLEMTDSALLAQLTEPIAVVFRSTLESQRDAWDTLRERNNSDLRGETLFTKRLSGSPLRKRRRKEKEEDKEIPCAHQDCLRPTSSLLQWVKCELCKRYYHVICTGKIIDPDLSDYKCC